MSLEQITHKPLKRIAAGLAAGATIMALGLTGPWAAAQQAKPQTMPFLTFPLDRTTAFTLTNAVSFGDGVIYTGANCPGQGCPPEQTLRNYDYWYRVQAGSKARAMADGEVAYVISQPGYEAIIWLWHKEQNTVTSYAGLSSALVRAPQKVTRGQTIGITSEKFQISAYYINDTTRDLYARKDSRNTGSLWLNANGTANCPVHAGDENNPSAGCIGWTNPAQPGSQELVLPKAYLPALPE